MRPNVRDKRAQQTSERNTFHFPTTIILNYTTIILGNNYNVHDKRVSILSE